MKQKYLHLLMVQARDLITWSDNDQFKRAMFGTAQMLYEHNGDQIFDVTPVSASATLTNAFTCAISTNTVTVSATAHGRQQVTLYSLQVLLLLVVIYY